MPSKITTRRKWEAQQYCAPPPQYAYVMCFYSGRQLDAYHLPER